MQKTVLLENQVCGDRLQRIFLKFINFIFDKIICARVGLGHRDTEKNSGGPLIFYFFGPQGDLYFSQVHVSKNGIQVTLQSILAIISSQRQQFSANLMASSRGQPLASDGFDLVHPTHRYSPVAPFPLNLSSDHHLLQADNIIKNRRLQIAARRQSYFGFKRVQD